MADAEDSGGNVGIVNLGYLLYKLVGKSEKT
jgi:hypothetical protein